MDKITYAPELRQARVLRYADRMGKGLEYLRVVEKVSSLLVSEQLRQEQVVLALDATGMGDDVFELAQSIQIPRCSKRQNRLASVDGGISGETGKSPVSEP